MGDYIMELRKKVGHSPIILCGASVIVENERGEILMQLRSDNGMWAYAGGAVELYEAVEDAARRELFEETGLRADELELLGVFSGEGLRFTYPNGDMASIIDITYICRKYHGELKCQRGEVERLGFFKPESLPEPISTPSKPALKRYLELRGIA